MSDKAVYDPYELVKDLADKIGIHKLYAIVRELRGEPDGVIPHQNYKYLSDYWCECGWHLGKKGDVKYCSDCGRKVNWDE